MTTWQWIMASIILLDFVTAAYHELFKDDDVKTIKFYLFGLGLYVIGFV